MDESRPIFIQIAERVENDIIEAEKLGIDIEELAGLLRAERITS